MECPPNVTVTCVVGGAADVWCVVVACIGNADVDDVGEGRGCNPLPLLVAAAGAVEVVIVVGVSDVKLRAAFIRTFTVDGIIDICKKYKRGEEYLNNILSSLQLISLDV